MVRRGGSLPAQHRGSKFVTMAPDGFANRNVVVTGGAGAIGAAICEAFAAQGAKVVSADLPATLAAASGSAPGITAHPLDVTSEESWVALLDHAETAHGPLDILVNNAGIYRPNIPFEDMALSVWKEHLAVNADGVFLGCKHAIQRMKTHGGAIVNMGSGMSITANPTGAAYCASKAAVLMTTRTAAAAAGRYGIRVNAVLPGAVPTPMLMGNVTADESEQDFLARMETYGCLGRLATPQDIARAVLFLADPANPAITGVFLPVDGGNLPGA